MRLVDWREAEARLAPIRYMVFVEEQKVPVEIEMDGLDAECAHAVAETLSGEAIGTGRLLPDGRIGRMAVLAGWRGKGVGAAILVALMDEARRRGFRETYLHAQAHAKAFYLRNGYLPHGDEYLEAGIAHLEMRAKL